MKKITKDGIELLEFNHTEEELIVRTIGEDIAEAYEDMFSVMPELETYFIPTVNSDGKNTYQALPRLYMSLNVEIVK